MANRAAPRAVWARIATAVVVALTVVGGMLIGLPVGLPPASATMTPVTLLTPEIVRSNGADLQWTRYTGTDPFTHFEVHRLTSSTAAVSSSTRLTTIEDIDTVRFTDTTAASTTTYYYRVLTVGPTSSAVSAPITVTTEADGMARATLQPGPWLGRGTFMRTTDVAGSTCPDATQWGNAADLRVGTSRSGSTHRSLLGFDTRRIPPTATVTGATLTLNWDAFANNPGTGTGMHVHAATRAWTEGYGGGGCGTGKGATWLETAPGVRWTAQGGDLSAALAQTVAKDRRVAGVDTFTGSSLTNYVQQWVNGSAPNFGLVLKLVTETLPSSTCTQPCEKYFDYDSDDSTVAAERPKLVITYQDNSQSVRPSLTVTSPPHGPVTSQAASLPINRGMVKVAAAVSDDRRVDKVEFSLGGSGAVDTTPPFEATFDHTNTGDSLHYLEVIATDDAGNQTFYDGAVRIYSPAAPTTTISAPLEGAPVAGAVPITADAVSAAGVSKVEFFADGEYIGEDTSAPYTATWQSANQEANVYDGAHVLTTKVYDVTGQVASSSARNVTVGNTNNTSKRATFDLGDEGPHDDEFVIESVSREGNGAKARAGNPMSNSPLNSSGGGSCGDDRNCFKVRVKNTSSQNWPGGALRLWYRWYNPDGLVVFEGPAGNDLPAIGVNAEKEESVEVQVPGLPDGADSADYRLRLDVYDNTGQWFAGAGNPPVDRHVKVTKDDRDYLGLERWWGYHPTDVGAGMQHMANVASGNSVLHWQPFDAPGRGLSTIVGLTYNSLEDHSDSPAGNNVSMTVSGLSRLGNRLDVHPNKADSLSNDTNRQGACWIAFTDGDGTRHRFDGLNGCSEWKPPAGVHLYLRREAGTDPNRGYLLTRPDRTTFKYDVDGYPVSVADRNGNTLSFTLSDVDPGEDPGGNKKRVTRVTDAGGRHFDIEYYSKDEARKAHVRGKVKRVVDHSGSALVFEYYEDGNLRRLRQPHGVDVLGNTGPDRVFTFTYTTPSGDGPAIPLAADRVEPDPRTPSQSTRIYSVRDGRGKETLFSYYTPPDAPALRWKLKTLTDRAGKTTSFSYDTVARTATVAMPLGRSATWHTDDRGRPTDQVDALGRHVYQSWSDSNHLTSVSDPTTALRTAATYQTFEHNSNGMLTKAVNQAGETHWLEYADTKADAADPGFHHSDLTSLTKPKGAGHTWTFGLDPKGNVTTVTAPKVGAETVGPTWTVQYNPDGTVWKSTDPNNRTTTISSYDPSGQPTAIEDGAGGITRVEYDVDGLVRGIQDPNHEGAAGAAAERMTRLEYDDLHQLVRTSEPKSTKYERQTLIWNRQQYDANGNAVKSGEPTVGGSDRGWVAFSAYEYDAMDRLTADTDPTGKTWRTEYDDAGRAIRNRSPMAATTASTDDYTTFVDYDLADRVIRTARHEVVAGAITKSQRTHQCYETDDDVARIVAPNANLATVDCANPGTTAGLWSTVFEYDAAHRLIKATDAEGRITERGYDDHGNAVTSKDAGGVTVTDEYDQRDQRVKSTQPFDTNRNVVTQWRYDGVGNVVKSIPPRASDAAGAAEPVHFTTEFAYDGANRLVRVKEPTSATEIEASYTHIARDANGNETMVALPTTHADVASVPDGAKTKLTRFDPGWIRSSDDPSLPPVRFDYDPRGLQTERTPGLSNSPNELDLNQTMTWRYTLRGELSSISDRTGQLSSFGYNDDGLLINATDSSGINDPTEKARQVVTGYDGFNRVARVSHKKTTETSYGVTEYGYDLNGNILTRNDNGTSSSTTAAVSGASRNTFTYDRTGRGRTQLELGTDLTCAGDRLILRDFSPQGWEKERVFQASTATTCASDAANTAFTMRQTSTWGHFLNGKHKTLQTVDRYNQVVESHAVGYTDPGGVYVNGQRTQDTFTLKGPGATTCSTTPCTATYTYDAKDRLISHDDGHGGVTSYMFDEAAQQNVPTLRAGNLTREVSGTTVRQNTYQGDRLATTTVGTDSRKYFYDALGNVDCVTTAVGVVGDCSPQEGQTVSANLWTDYGYDGLDRLVTSRSWAAASLTRVASYMYDALDRVVKEDDRGSNNNRTTLFSYQGLTDLVSKEDITLNSVANAESKRYGYDMTGTRLSMARSLNGGAAVGYTYGYDVHGSTSLLIDEAAVSAGTRVKASYGYKPYGATDDALTKGDTDGFSQINPYRYSAKRFDIGSQTHDMGARRLGGVSGRFLQQDKYYGAMEDLALGTDPLSRNRYALAGGNPIGYIEWDGHVAIDADGSGGGAPSGGDCGISCLLEGDAPAATGSGSWLGLYGGGSTVDTSTPCGLDCLIRGEGPKATKQTPHPWFTVCPDSEPKPASCQPVFVEPEPPQPMKERLRDYADEATVVALTAQGAALIPSPASPGLAVGGVIADVTAIGAETGATFLECKDGGALGPCLSGIGWLAFDVASFRARKKLGIVSDGAQFAWDLSSETTKRIIQSVDWGGDTQTTPCPSSNGQHQLVQWEPMRGGCSYR